VLDKLASKNMGRAWELTPLPGRELFVVPRLGARSAVSSKATDHWPKNLRVSRRGRRIERRAIRLLDGSTAHMNIGKRKKKKKKGACAEPLTTIAIDRVGASTAPEEGGKAVHGRSRGRGRWARRRN